MKSQTKTLLVLLSVTLNVAFGIGWSVRALRGSAGPEMSPADARTASLEKQLGLSAEQGRQIESTREAFRQSARSIAGEMNRHRQELLELLAAPEPDRESLRAKQHDIQSGQRQMQELVLEHILAEKQALLPAQQQKYFALLRRQSEGPRRGGIGHWLQSAQTNPPAPASSANR